MTDSVKNNSFAKIVLLIIGVFVSAVVVIIAINVSKQVPETVNVSNIPLANTTTNTTVDPIIPIQPDIVYSATGTVTEKRANTLTVNADIYVQNALTERTYTVEVTPQTTYTQISSETGATAETSFGSIAVGDEITFRADENLLEKTSVVATMIEKLVP